MKIKSFNSEKFKLYMMTVPGIAVFLSVIIFPICFSFYASFTRWRSVGLKPKWIGLSNYISIFNDERFINALKNNIFWIIGYFLVPVILGFFVAVLLNQRIRGENIFKTAIYYPGVLSFIVTGTIFSLIYNYRYGLINDILERLGLEFLIRNWLGNSSTALIMVILTSSWMYVGFVMIMYLSGIRNVPVELLEAADMDGAGFFRKIFSIILPIIKPVTTIVFAITVINAFKVFDIIFVMTGGGPERSTEVLGYTMYEESFLNSLWGKGSAYGVIIFIITSIIGYVYVSQMIKEDNSNE